MSKLILHLDMDAFFAAIEQTDHPEWRGKPLVVGAAPQGGHGRGVVSTCSYEARKYGIRSAMPISKAYRLCPHAIYVRPRGKRYAEVSRTVMQILQSYSPDTEPVSIDEAFLDISSSHKLFGGTYELAVALKEQIKKETQLTASVGIAPNKFVAKIASDLEKPDGLVMVEEGEVKMFLAPLEISRLWGVGAKTRPHLEKLGIRTIGDLARFSQQELVKKFGKAGLHFWNLANGIDKRDVIDEIKAKSMSKEITFDYDSDDEEHLRKTLLYLCDDLSYEMRKKGFRGRTVTLKIRLEDFSTYTRSRTLIHVTDNSSEIHTHAEALYNTFDKHGMRVRLLGVSLSHFVGREEQMELFGDQEKQDERIDRVMDEVRKKFGDHAITRARLIDNHHDSAWIRE